MMTPAICALIAFSLVMWFQHRETVYRWAFRKLEAKVKT